MSQDDASPPPSEPGPVWMTPVRARELAAAAEDLARQVQEGEAARVLDGDEPRRRAGFRLGETVAQLRAAAVDLLATAEDLARLASRPSRACSVPSGVCPEHGPTLTETGGGAWCTAPGCRRRWGYNRLTQPCAEPVTHAVHFTTGEVLEVCDGHAIDARQRVVGGAVTPLSQSGDQAQDGTR